MTDEPLNAYERAFQVGMVGNVLLVLFLHLLPALTVLLLLTIWLGVVLFVLPWLVVCYRNGSLKIPPWFTRGPHQ